MERPTSSTLASESKVIPFLQGMFFQEGLVPYIGYSPMDGAVAMLGEMLVTTLFQGLIWGPGRGETFDGIMFDRHGLSELWETEITEQRVRFIKRYRGRDDEILYVFDRKEGNVWQGYWELSTGLARGTAWCVVTDVDMAVTDPTYLKTLMSE